MIDLVSVISAQGSALGLFLVAFLAASILPFPSEPAAVLALKYIHPAVIFIVMVIGGTLGAVFNYYIGLKGIHNWLAKRNPKDEKKAEDTINRHGEIGLMLVPWIPFVGDPMTIVAGALKMRFRKFLFWMIISRAVKTIALIWFGEKLLAMFKF